MPFTQLYRFGPFLFDPVDVRLMRGTEILPFTPKAFAVLCYLIERHGRLVNKNELLGSGTK